MGVYYGELPDFSDLSAVIEMAQQLNVGISDAKDVCIVVKHSDRPNYNITFKSRPELWKNAEVVWTPDSKN